MKVKYRFEYNGNPVYVSIHFTELVTESGFVSSITDKATEEDKQLIGLLTGCKGVVGGGLMSSISLDSYRVTCARGAAFEREDVLLAMLEIMKIWFSISLAQELEWEQLPTLRSDLACKKCPACQAEQEREMRELDSLTW